MYNIVIPLEKRLKICEDGFRPARQTTKAGFVPGKEDNAAGQKADRKDEMIFKWFDYKQIS